MDKDSAKEYILRDLDEIRYFYGNSKPNLVNYYHMSQDDKDEAARQNIITDKKIDKITKEMDRVRTL